jgi:hypothetical protein
MMGAINRAGFLAMLLLTGCAVDEMKKSFNHLLGSEDSNSPTADINTIVPEASRVIDLGCPHIVQPYTLTSNAVSMAKLAATLGASNLDAVVGAHVEGHATGPGNDISATTRLAAAIRKKITNMPTRYWRMSAIASRKSMTTNSRFISSGNRERRRCPSLAG